MIMTKLLPKSLHMKVYKENLTVTLSTMGLERGRQCKSSIAAMRGGKRDKRTAALPATSPVFAINLNFSKDSSFFVIIEQSALKVVYESS